MLRLPPYRSVLPAVALGLLVLTGCGGKGVPAQGTLVLPPALKLQDTDTVEIKFVPENPGGKDATGKFSVADNSFVATSNGGKGVEPGHYKIAVHILPYPGNPDSATRAALLATLNNAYDLSHTRLTCDVTTDPSQSFTIDLARGTVTKG
jgi:hypothetical protein